MKHAPRAIVGLVGLCLGLAGITEGSDGIVAWVFDIVSDMAWADVWRPVYNPEPMDTWAYRPLAVVFLKLGLTVFGRDAFALTAVHAVVPLAFGWVALGCLRRHGFGPVVRTVAVVSALCMPSLLFSGWLSVEFDLVGATFVLAAINALLDSENAPSRRAHVRFWIFAVLAMTMKETSALQLLAWLVAFAWMRRSAPTSARWWKLSAAYLSGLVLCTLPMHFVPRSASHAFGVFGEDFHPMRLGGILLHTSAQVVFLLSAAGVALLVVASVRRRVPVAVALTLMLFAAPIVRWYSHFEAIIFSDFVWTLATSGGLLFALFSLWASPRTAEPVRTAVLAALFSIAGYAAAPVLLRFARPDVSARIFAALVPLLHAVAWRAAGDLLRTSSWPGRAAGGVLVALFGGFAVSAGFDSVTFHRARLAVELEAHRALAADVRMPCPAIVATNPVQSLTAAHLRDLGAKLGTCAWVEVTTSNPSSQQTLTEFAASGEIHVDPGQDAYLVVQTARSQMTPEVNLALAGDFSWARELLPEGDDDTYAGYQRMIYEPPTDIEALFEREGRRVVRARLPYVLVPLFWGEVVRRLATGVPLLERYEYVTSVYRVPARQPGFVPDGGRVRGDKGPR